MKKILIMILLAVGVLSVDVFAKDNTDLKRAELSVAYVVNPRLEKLPMADVKEIVAKAISVTSSRLGLKLKSGKIKEIEMEYFLDDYAEGIMDSCKIGCHIVSYDESGKKRLYEGFLNAYNQTSTKKLIASVKNQPNSDAINLTKGRNEILRQITSLHIDRLIEIGKIPTECCNATLVSDDMFNEYMVWDYVLEHQSKYDLIITNQLIASAETWMPSTHTSMRGGITSGFAGRSKGKYGGTVLMTTAPFTNKHPFFKKARGGRNYSRTEAIDTIAYTTVHEFGHLFKYRGHHYDHPSCVMRPAPGLLYLEWMQEVKKRPRCDKLHENVWGDYYMKNND